MRRLDWSAFMLVALLGCSGPGNSLGPGEEGAGEGGLTGRPGAGEQHGPRRLTLTPNPVSKDPLTVERVTLEGDTLILEVTHAGGCVEHEYGLAWDGLFLESDPPQVNLVPLHDARGDACKALIQKTLAFDLSLLKARWREAYHREHGTLFVQVVGAPDSVRYTFQAEGMLHRPRMR
jgi:hypothetical protein